MPPPPSQGPGMPCSQGVLQALQQAACKAQSPHPWGHAPEQECLKPPPAEKSPCVSFNQTLPLLLWVARALFTQLRLVLVWGN